MPVKIIQNIDKYYIEVFLILFAVVYILNYFVGKNTNLRMAASWVHDNREVFEQNFAILGVSNGQSGGALLDEESASCYKFYATGRVNCHFAMTTIDLKKRQDILSNYFLSIIWPEKDRVTIDVNE